MTTPPTQIGGYRINRVLATGGMGAVYLVHSPTLPQREVLKVLPAELARNPALRARFLNEANTTAGLQDPHIVSVYARGQTDDGQLWIAMQYVAGTDAEAALRAGTMTPSRAIRIVTEVAKVLDYAHARGVVHQDIKPSNILLGDRPRGQQERVMLADFGAAFTLDESADPSSGPMIASLAYAAPEVIAGNSVDGRADVYSLGCTLFRLLTGRYPFPGHEDVSATIKAHLDQRPLRISDYLSWASPQLDDVIAKALAKDPTQRYATAGEFGAAARHALDAAKATTPPPTAQASSSERAASAAAVDFIGHLPRTRPVASRQRILAAVGIAAALIAVGLVVWLALPAREPTHSTPPPTTSATTDPSAAAKLTDVVPPAYPAGSCTPAAINADLARAALSGGPALGPDAPPTAIYTLARNRTARQALFAQQTAAATAVVCPGNIQSPWHRAANPTVPVGTVFCGLKSGRPVVAWTTDDKLLMATIEAKAPDSPTLDQLYTWWASHS